MAAEFLLGPQMSQTNWRRSKEMAKLQWIQNSTKGWTVDKPLYSRRAIKKGRIDLIVIKRRVYLLMVDYYSRVISIDMMGVSIHLKNCSFGNSTCTFKVNTNGNLMSSLLNVHIKSHVSP
jgi:hypothetical protein